MNVTIIRTDGTKHQMQVQSMAEVPALIGAEALDTVTLGGGLVMLVDDNGYDTVAVQHDEMTTELRPVKARKPVNALATVLYHAVCRPGTTHQIVGDVCIVDD